MLTLRNSMPDHTSWVRERDAPSTSKTHSRTMTDALPVAWITPTIASLASSVTAAAAPKARDNWETGPSC